MFMWRAYDHVLCAASRAAQKAERQRAQARKMRSRCCFMQQRKSAALLFFRRLLPRSRLRCHYIHSSLMIFDVMSCRCLCAAAAPLLMMRAILIVDAYMPRHVADAGARCRYQFIDLLDI